MWNPPANLWHFLVSDLTVVQAIIKMLESVENIKYKSVSPAKKLRSLRRLYSFRKKKLALSTTLNLSICSFKPINIYPVQKIPNLVMENTSDVNIQQKSQHLTISQPTFCSFPPLPPQPKHHPNIVEACRLMYGKHPDKLSLEERNHFRGYRQWKEENGEPIEDDFVNIPR